MPRASALKLSKQKASSADPYPLPSKNNQAEGSKASVKCRQKAKKNAPSASQCDADPWTSFYESMAPEMTSVVAAEMPGSTETDRQREVERCLKTVWAYMNDTEKLPCTRCSGADKKEKDQKQGKEDFEERTGGEARVLAVDPGRDSSSAQSLQTLHQAVPSSSVTVKQPELRPARAIELPILPAPAPTQPTTQRGRDCTTCHRPPLQKAQEVTYTEDAEVRVQLTSEEAPPTRVSQTPHIMVYPKPPAQPSTIQVPVSLTGGSVPPEPSVTAPREPSMTQSLHEKNELDAWASILSSRKAWILFRDATAPLIRETILQEIVRSGNSWERVQESEVLTRVEAAWNRMTAKQKRLFLERVVREKFGAVV